jgi:hypothetical protein
MCFPLNQGRAENQAYDLGSRALAAMPEAAETTTANSLD